MKLKRLKKPNKSRGLYKMLKSLDYTPMINLVLALCYVWRRKWSSYVCVYTLWLQCGEWTRWKYDWKYISFLLLSCKNSLFSLERTSLPDTWSANICSHYLGCLLLSWYCPLMERFFKFWLSPIYLYLIVFII